jgi:superfamily II DNA/RNA helicase
VVQALVPVPHDDRIKREALRRLLRSEPVKSALAFCNRKRDVDIVYKSLKKHGFNVGALHGDMDQSTRMETLDAFKRGEVTLLICSDVAARGLDIDDVSHVFNFDVPIHAEDYVHRIGRTGRAGRTGHAFTLATPEEGKFVAAIESLTKKPIPRVTVVGLEEMTPSGGDELQQRRRKQGSRGAGRHREARPPREPREAPAAPPPAPEPVPLARQKPRRERARDRDHERDEQPVIGMGDHVPAFLLRGRRAAG